MGLDTSHDCWSGAYSAFTRWRNTLAEVAGYWVVKVDEPGFLGKTVMVDWGHITEENLQGEWDEPPADPLMHIIAHSDCDGLIRSQYCKATADRLTELLPLLPAEDDAGHIGNWREKTQRFIDGLRLAAERGEDVDFH